MCIVAAAVGLAVVGTAASMQAAENMEDAQYAAAQEQKKVQREQTASNAAQAAAERRRQVREERVARARVLQTGAATGTVGSSGELGAIGSLATQFSSNIGSNLGSLQTANNISIFSQTAADFNSQAGALGQQSQMYGQIASMALSLNSSYQTGKAPTKAK
jgi:hypothetical protein